jgi:hypothetical protein
MLHMMINPIGPPTNVVDYGQYNYPRTTKTITTTREYDGKGNLVKETVVETTYGAGDYTPYWQNPIVSHGTITKADPYTYTINHDDGHTVTVNTETF